MLLTLLSERYLLFWTCVWEICCLSFLICLCSLNCLIHRLSLNRLKIHLLNYLSNDWKYYYYFFCIFDSIEYTFCGSFLWQLISFLIDFLLNMQFCLKYRKVLSKMDCVLERNIFLLFLLVHLYHLYSKCHTHDK